MAMLSRSAVTLVIAPLALTLTLVAREAAGAGPQTGRQVRRDVRWTGEVTVPERGRFDASFQRFEIRAPDFRLLVNGRPVAMPEMLRDLQLFRGTLPGAPSAQLIVERAGGAIVDGSVTWDADEYEVSGENGRLRARQVPSVRGIDSSTCSVRRGSLAGDERSAASAGSGGEKKPRRLPPVPIPAGVYGARILVATDYALFQQEGPDLAVMAAKVLKRLAQISQLLEQQVGLRLEVAEISIRDTPGDPTWLEGGAAAYLSDHPSSRYPRAFVTLLQSEDGGAGDLASLCAAYDRSGALDLAIAPFAVETMAHEIGHVLGSDHTHCYGFTSDIHYQGIDDTALVRGPDGAPPIDRCADQPTCYQGDTVAQVPASIMSYCARPSFSYGEAGKYGEHSERVLGLMRATVERAAARYPKCLDKLSDAVDLQGEATGETSLRLHWNDIFEDETGWTVEQLGKRNRWTTVASAPAGSTEIELTGVRAQSSPTFRLTATFAGNVSEPSLPVTVPVP